MSDLIKPKKKKSASALKTILAKNDFPEFCVRMGLSRPLSEHVFHPKRDWRMDFAWPEYKIFLECDGGLWSGGRHARPQGILNDMEKFNEATCLGWRPLQVTPKSLLTLTTYDLVRRAIKNESFTITN